MCESNILFHYFSVHNSPSKTHHELFAHHPIIIVKDVSYSFAVSTTTIESSRVERERRKERRRREKSSQCEWPTYSSKIFLCVSTRKKKEKRKREEKALASIFRVGYVSFLFEKMIQEENAICCMQQDGELMCFMLPLFSVSKHLNVSLL